MIVYGVLAGQGLFGIGPVRVSADATLRLAHGEGLLTGDAAGARNGARLGAGTIVPGDGSGVETGVGAGVGVAAESPFVKITSLFGESSRRVDRTTASSRFKISFQGWGR